MGTANWRKPNMKINVVEKLKFKYLIIVGISGLDYLLTVTMVTNCYHGYHLLTYNLVKCCTVTVFITCLS